MKNTGVCKTIDDLGRIVLPKEIRKNLGFDIRSSVELYVEDDRLIIKKAEESCIFCGSSDDLTEFKEKNVCQKCINTMKR
ncbi:MAG: AbrB/MazE/SpoVT family DNA-binding domain-containing protein [Clostridium sp.]|nr:AbrB/MazE/SpoVT family DNA-binding domain-containing protein [Clostridium sp.]MCM1547823.1 AbrB/MazE/SpoVT family DNA-binding domain-containing protein [Ruminococcus sp.]